MITKFDSSYAGHIDIENVGYAGIPVNDRFYSIERFATEVMPAVKNAKAALRALAT